MSGLPVVAVVGRPNTGKSTLVNRFIGRREAITQELPGVTRDRVVYRAEWLDRPFWVVDTGGLEPDADHPLAARVTETARAAAAEADLTLLVVDVTDGVTPADREVAEVLRRLGRPVIVVANKADNAAREEAAAEFFELGLGEPHPVSALHGRRTGDLLDVVAGDFPPEEEEPEEPGVAVVGRPNVGKSSLFNRLVGAERSIVHTEPGTTRDAVDTVLSHDDMLLRFVDTAGMRRQTKIDDSTEYYAWVRTMRALDRSELALLVLDASEGIARQDLRIAESIVEQGRSAIVVLNKIDLLDPADRKAAADVVRYRLPHLDFAPLVQTSAVTGEGCDRILPLVGRILAARVLRVPTPLLNAAVEDTQARTPIPSSGKHVRVKYAVQAEAGPPVIVLFGPRRIPDRWLRHLERSLRRRFPFDGTPIRFVLRGGTPRRGGEGGRRRPRSRRR